MTDKMLRDRLYARQRKLLRRKYETVCLHGMLLAVNPDLLSGKWPKPVYTADDH